MFGSVRLLFLDHHYPAIGKVWYINPMIGNRYVGRTHQGFVQLDRHRNRLSGFQVDLAQSGRRPVGDVERGLVGRECNAAECPRNFNHFLRLGLCQICHPIDGMFVLGISIGRIGCYIQLVVVGQQSVGSRDSQPFYRLSCFPYIADVDAENLVSVGYSS